MSRSRQIVNIARKLYDAGALSEAKALLNVRSNRGLIRVLQDDLIASGEPVGKVAGEISNLTINQKHFSALKKNKGFGYYDGNPDHPPILGRMIIDKTKKPKLNLVESASARFKHLRGIFQPHNQAERLYGMENSPVVECMDGWTLSIDNIAKNKVWLHNVVGKPKIGRASIVPTTGSKMDVLQGKPHQGLADIMQPVFMKNFSAYSAWLRARARRYALAAGLRKIEGRTPQLLEKMAAKTTDKTRAKRAIEMSKKDSPVWKKFEELTKKMEELEGKWRPAYTKAIMQAAKKFPDVRVYLAADSTWANGRRSLVNKLHAMMSPAERKATAQIKKYMKIRGKQLKKAGLSIIGDKQADFTYMPHVIRKHLTKSMPREFRSKFQSIPELLDFPYRLKGSVPWFPSARASMDWYIPQVNRHLTFQPFHDKWVKHVNSLGTAGPKGRVRNWWKAWFDQNLYATESTIFNKAIDMYTNIEYVRLVGFSPSVAFKHLLKVPGTYMEHGFGPSVTGFKEAMKYARVARKGARTNPYLKGSGQLANYYLADRYLKSKVLYQSLIEMPGMEGMWANARKFTSHPTAMVEFLDRGVSLFASIASGSKAGADFQKIHKGIWSTILDVNFMGGFDMYTWQRNPLARAATMFTMTPMKIFGHKVKLIEKAVKGEKDIFGENYGWKVLRGFVAVGMAEAIARHYGSSVWEWMIHPPFIYKDYRFGGHTMYQPPALRHLKEVEESGLKDGLINSMGYAGTFEKFWRINKGKIPKQYVDDPWRYILTLPHISTEQKMQAYSRARRDYNRWKKQAYRSPNLMRTLME